MADKERARAARRRAAQATTHAIMAREGAFAALVERDNTQAMRKAMEKTLERLVVQEQAQEAALITAQASAQAARFAEKAAFLIKVRAEEEERAAAGLTEGEQNQLCQEVRP